MIPGVTCDKEKTKVVNGQKQVTAQPKPQETPVNEAEKGTYYFDVICIPIILFYLFYLEDKKQEEPQFEMDI